MTGHGQPSTERQANQSPAEGYKFQGRREGGIHPTDGDGMGGHIYGENGNRMEERQGETETMDNEIHEPHY